MEREAARDPETLPDDPAALKNLAIEQAAEIKHLRRQIDQLQQGLWLLRRHMFGVKSERLPEGQEIFAFYGTLEPDRRKAASESEELPKPPGKKKGHGRRVIPDELPRRVIVHDLSDGEKTCPDCGKQLREFDRDRSEQLEYHPADIYVIRHERPKYSCPGCVGHVRVAPPGTSPIERGLAGPGLLAHVVVSKYEHHLPLYRQQRMLQNQGIRLTRSTLCGWVGQCVELLRPIYEAVVGDILESRILHTDDTPVKFLEPGERRALEGRLWAYVGDRKHRQVAYQFSRNREKKWTKDFLGDWRGFLQADAYKGYDHLFTGGTIMEVGCWAHARRKFFDAQGADEERAVWALGMIARLYHLERVAKEASAKDRRALRRRQARPVLEDLKTWLDHEILRVLPESAIGKAIQYARGQWEALVRYLDDGDLDIDNNECERLLRGVCVGRKNYLFFGRECGGEWAAVIYTLIESAKLAGVVPYEYLKDVLVRVSTHPMSRISELMPRCWKPQADTS